MSTLSEYLVSSSSTVFQYQFFSKWLLLLLAISSQTLVPNHCQSDVTATTEAPGLFPPLTLVGNSFASMTEASATSTCGVRDTCPNNGCPQNCNTTCPFGSEFPSSFDLLEDGERAGGVRQVRILN